MTEYDIVPTSLAVKAMRDNGYKNAAYALAELMDNSIQAGATEVELLCADRESMVDQRVRRRLNQVAVLDNGRGMDAGNPADRTPVWEWHAPRGRGCREGYGQVRYGPAKRIDLPVSASRRLELAGRCGVSPPQLHRPGRDRTG